MVHSSAYFHTLVPVGDLYWSRIPLSNVKKPSVIYLVGSVSHLCHVEGLKIGVYVRKLSHAPVLAHIEESIPKKSLGCSTHCKSVSRGSSVIRIYQVRIKMIKMVRSERLHQLRLIECKR